MCYTYIYIYRERERYNCVVMRDPNPGCHHLVVIRYVLLGSSMTMPLPVTVHITRHNTTQYSTTYINIE